MSDSENIALWKKKSEIDYISLFVPLWLSLDAWMRDRYIEDTDRKRLNLFKQGGHKIFEEFFTLLFGEDIRSRTFQGDLAELHRALISANITYSKDREKFISFSCALDVQEGGRTRYIDLLEKEETEEEDKITLAEGLFIVNDVSVVFLGFIEILYEIRCALFHGDLKPNEVNERVIKQLYLITVEITRRV